MTVESTVNKSGPYAGAGSPGPFTVGFRFLDQTHLRVIKTSVAGVNSDLVLTTDYSVDGVGDPTGSVTLTVALAVGEKLTIVRKVPFTQEADYVQNDAFPAQSHEDALDKLTMEVQQLDERVSSALTLPPNVTGADTELPVPQANFLIGWDPTATGLANIDPGTLAGIVAYGNFSSQIFNGNGTTGPFTLTSSPVSVNNAAVFISGIRQRPVLDYNVSGVQLTFASNTPVGVNNILVVWGSALAIGDVADLSVTTGKIVNGAVTVQKLAPTLISAAPAETAPAADDKVLLSDTSEGALNGITLADLLKVVNALTEDTTPDLNADFILTYDTSAGAVNKVLLGRAGSWTYLPEQASTSGTFIDFTGFPTWTTEVEIMFVGVSTNGTSDLIVQIGDSGGLETSGYLGSCGHITASPGATLYTTGFGVVDSLAATDVHHGSTKLSLENSSTVTWVCNSTLSSSGTARILIGTGSKSLSPGPLDRVRVTTLGGVNTLDAGVIRARYR